MTPLSEQQEIGVAVACSEGSSVVANVNVVSSNLITRLVASPRTPSPTPAWDTGWEREAIVRQGVFTAKGDGFEVTQDYTFSSPSTASGVLLGRTSNGRVEWKAADERTLRNIQDAENE